MFSIKSDGKLCANGTQVKTETDPDNIGVVGFSFTMLPDEVISGTFDVEYSSVDVEGEVNELVLYEELLSIDKIILEDDSEIVV